MPKHPVRVIRCTPASAALAMFHHEGRSIEPLQGFIDAPARSGLRFRLGLLPRQRHDRRFAALRERSGYLGGIVFHGMSAARE